MGACCLLWDSNNLNECFKNIDISTVHDVWFIDVPQNTKQLGFCKGRFDNWCILFICLEDDGFWHRYAPKDKYYFNQLLFMSKLHHMNLSSEKIWNHMLWLFYRMSNSRNFVNPEIMKEIHELCNNEYYHIYDIALECFMLIYFGMIAEENKLNTKAGREIKMNGIHKVLMEKVPVDIAATCQCSQSVNNIITENRSFGLLHEIR